ncbi:MAG: TetR/AcrR family transcriptional regulator [Clostridia bacterium]|nr:TetR/AcrR family transcriptional regulator [Clostridia bacterium]
MSLQQAKINYIVETAAALFLERGIGAVTIKDVATQVGVGEATVYRYFATKQHLVILAAQQMADDIHASYFDLTKAQTGLDKLRAFYRNFLRIYLEHPEYYRFIFEFDATVQAQVGLEGYEKTLLPYLQDYMDAYQLGREDGSVQEVEDVKLFYLTTTHALLGLCKKLTMDKVVLEQDAYGRQEIECLIRTIVYSLTNSCV